MKRKRDGRATVTVSPTTAGILAGELDLSSWSLEELRRGQLRGSDGKWHGRPPQVVPKAIHDELVKRKMSKAFDLLRSNTYKAVKVLAEIATDKSADPAVRVKAASEILDRALGKAPEHVSLDIEMQPWQRAIAQSIVGRDLRIVATEEQAKALDDDEDAEIVDGELVEAEPEPEPRPKIRR